METNRIENQTVIDAIQHLTVPPHGELKRYFEFVPDRIDLEVLARPYLEEFVDLDAFSFFSGSCESGSVRASCRFEIVVAVLGVETRQQIIDDLDQGRARSDGDQWQFCKYSYGEGFWSTPADFDAVFRVAASIPDDISDGDAGQYGAEFLDTVQIAKRQKEVGGSNRSSRWIKEGF